MSVRYKYSGLTEELYQRLVSEHAELRKAHKKGTYLTNYSTTFKTICLLITQEGKPLNQFWIKSTQDCQGNCLNGSKRKWKNYARNTLTT